MQELERELHLEGAGSLQEFVNCKNCLYIKCLIWNIMSLQLIFVAGVGIFDVLFVSSYELSRVGM